MVSLRVAATTIDGIRLSTVLWVDSSLVAVVSADLGSEAKKVERRRGRHKGDIDCPLMVFVRGENFRAVDINDQMRLGKVRFAFSCKRKAWPKLFFACLIELALVNIYIIVIWTNPTYKHPNGGVSLPTISPVPMILCVANNDLIVASNNVKIVV